MIQCNPESADISILVIDDDESIRQVLTTYLAGKNYAVESESCGEAGLGAMADNRFDIIITDLKMPGISGLEVVQRAKEKNPDVEVIVLTGFATIHDGVEAMKRGAYDFLMKPVRIDQLDATVTRCAKWIRHKQAHKELREVNKKLLELTEMKEKFLAIADHELRTPVTVLDGMLNLLARQSEGFPESTQQRLSALKQVSRRLVHLVRDIHDILQSRKQTLEINADSARITEIFKGIEVDFEMARFSRPLNLEFETKIPNDFFLEVDVYRIRQAVSELIQNSVKATPDGGNVKVRAYLGEDEKSAQGRLCIEVADNGVGVPEKERERIFDIFHGVGDELHHHTSKFDFMGSGLGIGLSIALEIAKAHDGGIDYSPASSGGSIFTFWMPLQKND